MYVLVCMDACMHVYMCMCACACVCWCACVCAHPFQPLTLQTRAAACSGVHCPHTHGRLCTLKRPHMHLEGGGGEVQMIG